MAIKQELLVGFTRLTGFPLDDTTIAVTYDDAVRYSRTDVAYPGQIVIVLNDNNPDLPEYQNETVPYLITYAKQLVLLNRDAIYAKKKMESYKEEVLDIIAKDKTELINKINTAHYIKARDISLFAADENNNCKIALSYTYGDNTTESELILLDSGEFKIDFNETNNPVIHFSDTIRNDFVNLFAKDKALEELINNHRKMDDEAIKRLDEEDAKIHEILSHKIQYKVLEDAPNKIILTDGTTDTEILNAETINKMHTLTIDRPISSQIHGLDYGTNVKDKQLLEVVETILTPYREPVIENIKITINDQEYDFKNLIILQEIDFDSTKLEYIISNISFDITANSNDITSLQINIGSNVFKLTKMLKNINNNPTISQHINLNVNYLFDENTLIEISANDETTIISKTCSLNLYKPCIVAKYSASGIICDNLLIDPLIFYKNNETTIKISTVNESIVLIIPNELSFNKILDENKLNIIKSFELVENPSDIPDGYKMHMKFPATLTDYEITFIKDVRV